MNMQHRKLHETVQKLLEETADDGKSSGGFRLAPYDAYGPCGDPEQYLWHYAGRKEMLVPCNCALTGTADDLKSQPIRWEAHQVLVVEGNLRRGESNIAQRRVFYIGADSGRILLGETYDITGTMQKCYLLDSYPPARPAPRGRWYDL